jgi:tetratricopeptide (TPR) repeat protein
MPTRLTIGLCRRSMRMDIAQAFGGFCGRLIPNPKSPIPNGLRAKAALRRHMTAVVILLVCPAHALADQSPPVAAPADAPASAPTRRLPHLAAAGFELAAGADQRDKWMPIAIEETLAWRLRRVPGLLTVPAVRVHQARRELQEEGADPPPWPRVVAALGADYMLTGRCTGPPFEAALHVTLLVSSPPPSNLASRPSTAEAEVRVLQEVDLPPGKLFDVLDAATQWALRQFAIHELPQPVQRMIYGPPCHSPSALEYYARAITAARADDLRTAYDYAMRSLTYDELFRAALALTVQLEIQSGPAGQNLAGRHLRQWAELARIDSDAIDRSAAELGLGTVLHIKGSFDAAYQRYETALAMAYADDSPYGQMMAANSLADLFLTRRLPPKPSLPATQLRSLAEQDLRSAAAWQEIALDLAAGLGDVVSEAPYANKLALTYERLGEWEAAIAMHNRSLAAAQQVGSRSNEATAWICLAQAYQRAGEGGQALAAGKHALETASPSFQPIVQVVIGGAYRTLKQPDAALTEYEGAYRKLREAEDLGSQLVCLRAIAELRMELGRRQDAVSAFKEAIEVAHALSATEQEASLRKQLAECEQTSR